MSLKNRYEDLSSEEVRRQMRELTLHGSTSLRSPPPRHDPLTTVLFTAFNTIGFSVVASQFLASAATALVTTPVIHGIQVRS